MNPLLIIMLAFAFVCFVMATFNQPSAPRWNLIAGGLAWWVLAEMLFGLGHIVH